MGRHTRPETVIVCLICWDKSRGQVLMPVSRDYALFDTRHSFKYKCLVGHISTWAKSVYLPLTEPTRPDRLRYG